MRALALALRDHLRSGQNGGLNYDPAYCDIGVDGKPPPSCGQWAVVIHPGSWHGQYVEGMSETVALSITVSVRAPVMPFDREGKLLYEKTPQFKGLWWFIEEIRAGIPLDLGGDDILNAANRYINAAAPTGSANGFVETMTLVADYGRPMRQGSSWFSSDETEVEVAGLSQTISLGGFGRYQRIENPPT